VKRVVIVGGGIAGLATAFNLRERADASTPLDIVVLEAGDRAGGNIRTERVDGYTLENGPNGFLDNAPKTLDLVRRIGRDAELQRADEAAAKRFIFRAGRLHEAPTGPLSFLRSPLLSLRGRLRVFAEPFARARPADIDESVYQFAARRIGPEAAAVLVDAMVSGVFAGDVRGLSLASAFPKMASMEEEYGGLVKAMVGRMKERKSARADAEARAARGEDVEALTRPGGPAGPGGTLTSFEGGLDRLIDGLTDRLGPVVRLDATVAAVEIAGGSGAGPADGARDGREAPEDGSRPWRIRLASGEGLDADAVVVTVPSPRAAPLLEPVDGELARTVASIDTAGLAVVALGYDAAAIPPVDGFGFLVPRGESLRILGCLWDSSIFPGTRAPEGKVLLRSMIGGAHDPGAVSEDAAVLERRVRDDLARAMGVDAEPELTRVYRWPLGIGQYAIGHQERLDRIHARLRENPGLWVAGSSYYGVSMNACIEKADAQADEILDALAG
jgi:oxygen-dependent protoporphyrinogen oxidase